MTGKEPNQEAQAVYKKYEKQSNEVQSFLANVDHLAQNLDSPTKVTEDDTDKIISFINLYPEDFEEFQDITPNDLYDADILEYMKDLIHVFLAKIQYIQKNEIMEILVNEASLYELHNDEYKLKSLVLSCTATNPDFRRDANFIKNFVLTEAMILDKEQKLEFDTLFQKGILDQVEHLINNNFPLEQIKAKLNLISPLPQFVARTNELNFKAEQKSN
ncbi:hypothetical protein TVAG_079030 [Trichomonas vaginalis G3]|uniref:Uncharacterized protein n=1 Tax=Trichomonas vaginalis (strain ATCC PRA-98 / G3) TaxID=412133 RepID=A2GG85_TRIV3|nr:hypothetical protein TVAGG3_0171630 [Trichomonas vaginalis G3]EAX83832.1 hypothetical protein TVAG_079030 [Trichomonas vaginalis G3]KAI5548620.1 hypothetical protein TVAGG3_0171630 [Trichomonas vaginalis G3]|eukprot:XP_001296762.1 hypothetical protein [Trichomonas vaginalis G3]